MEHEPDWLQKLVADLLSEHSTRVTLVSTQYRVLDGLRLYDLGGETFAPGQVAPFQLCLWFEAKGFSVDRIDVSVRSNRQLIGGRAYVGMIEQTISIRELTKVT